MSTIVISPVPGRCRCEALCAGVATQCRKCHYRCRWYRRKAWRTNPVRQRAKLTSTHKKEVTA